MLLACTDDLVEFAAGKMARRRVGCVLNKTDEYTAFFSQRDMVALYAAGRAPAPVHTFFKKLLPRF